MKKAIIFICVIAVAITISSCRKRVYYYYAYCETGHSPPWEGTKREYPPNGAGADSQKLAARVEAEDHDRNIHGGCCFAEVRSGMYYK